MATVGKLSADSMAAIGRELRLKYKEIIAEGMPERFAKILRRLDEPSNEGSKEPADIALSIELEFHVMNHILAFSRAKRRLPSAPISQPWTRPECPNFTFRPGLRFWHETSALSISAFGSGCCRSPGRVANHMGAGRSRHLQGSGP